MLVERGDRLKEKQKRLQSEERRVTMREGEAFTRRYKRDWETKSVYASTALHYRFLYASRKNMKIFSSEN